MTDGSGFSDGLRSCLLEGRRLKVLRRLWTTTLFAHLQAAGNCGELLTGRVAALRGPS